MGGLTVKKTIILLIPLFLLLDFGGCATTDDLKKTQRDYESKISSQRDGRGKAPGPARCAREELRRHDERSAEEPGRSGRRLRQCPRQRPDHAGPGRGDEQGILRPVQGTEHQEPPGRHGIPDRLHRELPRHREEGNPQRRKGRGTGRGRRGDGGAEKRRGGGLQRLLQDSSRRASTSRPGRSS